MSLVEARPHLRPSRHSQCFEGRCQTWSSAPPAAAERQQDTSVGQAGQADGRHITVRPFMSLKRSVVVHSLAAGHTHQQHSFYNMQCHGLQSSGRLTALHSHRDYFQYADQHADQQMTDAHTLQHVIALILCMSRIQEGKETYVAPVPCFPGCKWRERCSWPQPWMVASRWCCQSRQPSLHAGQSLVSILPFPCQ